MVDINSARIHVLTGSDGRTFRDIRIAVAPYPLVPSCLPTAVLDLKELFEVV